MIWRFVVNPVFPIWFLRGLLDSVRGLGKGIEGAGEGPGAARSQLQRIGRDAPRAGKGCSILLRGWFFVVQVGVPFAYHLCDV